MNALREYIKQAACATPGEKIRSKGKGRGLGTGDGEGPRGVPIELKDLLGGSKKEKDDEDAEKTSVDMAYEEGVKVALAEYMKIAGGGGAGTLPLGAAGTTGGMGNNTSGVVGSAGPSAGVINPGQGVAPMSGRGFGPGTKTQAVGGDAAKGLFGGMAAPTYN